MSRNTKRTAPDPITLETPSYEVPTEFIDIPSQGQFYFDDHPLRDASSVEIRYMCASQEDLLNNQSLIRKGIVIDRFLKSILVDHRVNVNDLLIGDKNALTIGARITGYGEDYSARIRCNDCNETTEQHFDLSTLKMKPGSLEGYPSAAYVPGQAAFTIVLPVRKLAVTIKMLTGADELILKSRQDVKKKHKLPETPLTDLLLLYIASVDGDDDRGRIAQFIETMPARDSKYLRAAYQDICPSVDMKQEVSCDCGSVSEVTMPLGVNFFWSER